MVYCVDGKCFYGILQGLDQALNLLLGSAIERVFEKDRPPEDVSQGVTIIRGDSIVLIGECFDDLSSIEIESKKPQARPGPLPKLV